MMGLLEKDNPQVYQILLYRDPVGSRCNRMSKRVQHNRPTRVAMYSDCELTTELKSVLLEIAELWLLIYHRERTMRSSFLQLRKLKKKRA